MNRNELIDMIETGTTIVRNFHTEGSANISDARRLSAGTYEDWDEGDVVGHIVGWMRYSIDKLTCIKLGTKQSDEYAGVTGLDDINRRLYEKSWGKDRETLESEYIDATGAYLRVVALYTNSEINLDTFDTGFKMELWRYILMDTVIHPVQHVVYQYLKTEAYDKLVAAIGLSAAIFAKYSPGMEAYRLSEFGVDRIEYRVRLEKLAALFPGKAEVMEFVRVNG